MSEPPALSPDTTAQASATPEPPAGPAPELAQRPVSQPMQSLAPADLVPPPTVRERLAWYVGAVLLSCVLITCGMQLWKRDLHAPFYYDLDALLYLPLTRAIVEQ